MLRIPLLAAACSLLLVTTACKKDEVAPTTGELDLTLTYSNAYSGVKLSYSLYTEGAWAGPNTAGPLRQGTLGTITTLAGGRLQGGLTIRDLNPGNYVVTLLGNSPKSVQVTAGRTNQFTLDF